MMRRGPVRAAIAAAAMVAGAPAHTAWAQAQASVEARASITIIDPPAVGQTAALALGPVARPQGADVRAQAVDGRYQISGVAGDSYNIAVPASLPLVRAGGAEEVLLQLTPEGVVNVLPGAYGARATGSVAVQGEVDVQPNAVPGLYKGSFPVILSLQ